MFFYKNWESLCKYLQECGVHTCTAAESLSVEPAQRFVVLKHDVEGCVAKAHKLAQIERDCGIKGSYYVQGYLMGDAKNVALLREMQSWGHEISYHYDVLDACGGDYEAAMRQFALYLTKFNDEGFVFTTICQYGNPVKKRVGYTSNRDFFRKAEIKARFSHLVDMVVDYSQHIKQDYRYISDAGYCWNIITEPETSDLHPDVKNLRIGSFDNLKKEIDKGVSLVISTHPHRWESSAVRIYARIYFFKVVRAVVRVLRNVPGVETLLNKFYFLAKKI